MLSFTLTNAMLTESEQSTFGACLQAHGLDDAVWDVYACAMRASSSATHPRALRVYDGGRLVGAAFVVECRSWGRAVFGSPALHRPFDWIGLPAFVWIRVGFCAEGLANPGFIAAPFRLEDLVPDMLEYLRAHAYGLIVVDDAKNAALHPRARAFPYVNDGALALHGMQTVSDYIGQHRNIKRKIKEFENRGGRIDVRTGALEANLAAQFRDFVAATAETSLVYSPFQDIFPHLVAQTCACPSARMVHFVAHMKGETLGYHSFVQTGRALRMIHGAFDRQKPTTHHCYENLLIAIARYALDAGLETVYLGPVMNETKRRMVNTVVPASLHFYSRHRIIRSAFSAIFPFTRMQSRELLALSRPGGPAGHTASQSGQISEPKPELLLHTISKAKNGD